MKSVRASGLQLSFQHDGTLLVRSPALGKAVRIPPAAIAVLSFCRDPHTEEEVKARFGQEGAGIYRLLVDSNVLVHPLEVDKDVAAFQRFVSVDDHRRLLGDRARIDAYAAALAEVIEPGMVVMDAGTGTGILACVAARAGARKVYAVDHGNQLDLTRRVVADSGLGDIVECVQGDFATVDLPEQVDVVVTDTYGAFALAGGSAQDLEPCLRKHLAPGGVVVPGEISLHLAPVHAPKLHTKAVDMFGSVHGVDLRQLRGMAEAEGWTTQVPASGLLHAGVVVARLPPTVGYVNGAARIEGLPPGRLLGLAAWFTLHLSTSMELRTGPADPPTRWGQVYLPLTDLEVGVDGVLRLEVEVEPLEAGRGVQLRLDWTSGPLTGHKTWSVR